MNLEISKFYSFYSDQERIHIDVDPAVLVLEGLQVNPVSGLYEQALLRSEVPQFIEMLQEVADFPLGFGGTKNILYIFRKEAVEGE